MVTKNVFDIVLPGYGKAKQHAERLAEQLRALGVEPIL